MNPPNPFLNETTKNNRRRPQKQKPARGIQTATDETKHNRREATQPLRRICYQTPTTTSCKQPRPLPEPPYSPTKSLATVGKKEPSEGRLITLERGGTSTEMKPAKESQKSGKQTTVGDKSDEAISQRRLLKIEQPIKRPIYKSWRKNHQNSKPTERSLFEKKKRRQGRRGHRCGERSHHTTHQGGYMLEKGF